MNFASNELDHFPTELSALKNLTSLSLYDNKFDTFPVGITNIKSLKKLDINIGEAKNKMISMTK